jgi:hypothetical protein
MFGFDVIARSEATKQSIRQQERMDCFASLAMTVSKLSVSWGSGVYEKNSIVMPGLDPGIHPSSQNFFEEDGSPGQAR